ncbi:MAG: phosphotriesterase-related protein, partial [Rhodococcus sp.]|nr:phosphotriesterase-related protein [Rhodococcus sp. (in: high G+C Gram-positive bacteria)]
AHRETGCPITTHTRAQGRTGLLQQQVFRSAGVDLTRTVIGHCGDTDDMDYLHELIDGGSMLGMDRFGLDGFLSHERRVDVVARLCAEGYSDRLVLSHDAGCYMDVIDGEDATDVLGEKTNWHYQFIIKQVVPDLLAAGVTRSQVDDMLVHNPRRFLESACKGGY